MKSVVAFGLGMVLSIPVSSASPASRNGQVQVTPVAGPGQPFRVDATQATWTAIFDAVAAGGGPKVHHALSDDDHVTKRCEDALVERVMECLIGDAGSLIYRYGSDSSPGAATRMPTEAWVVQRATISAQSAGPSGSEGLAKAKKTSAPTHAPEQSRWLQPDQLAKEIEATRDPRQPRRIDALSTLALQSEPGNEQTRQALERAWSDPDPEARAQGLLGLSRVPGSDTASLVEQGLHDDDATVRLMAVNVAGSDPRGLVLLQQALNDSDEAVRIYAAMKLQGSQSSSAGEAPAP